MALVANGIAYLFAWFVKVTGYKYDLVSRVAPIFYLESVFALLIDIIFFDVSFSAIQIVGLVVVIGVFFTIIVKAYHTDISTDTMINDNDFQKQNEEKKNST